MISVRGTSGDSREFPVGLEKPDPVPATCKNSSGQAVLQEVSLHGGASFKVENLVALNAAIYKTLAFAI